jgi:hypothetical protein
MALQAPFTHMTPGLQSVSNTQAKAGAEVRQRIVTTINQRIVHPSWNSPKNHITEWPNWVRLVVQGGQPLGPPKATPRCSDEASGAQCS